MQTWNYTNLKSSSSATSWSAVSSVQRAATQSLGRPWVRMAPPIGVIQNTFADKTTDSRYDGTFVTTYRGNWDKAGVTNPVLYNANSLPVQPGGAILSFLMMILKHQLILQMQDKMALEPEHCREERIGLSHPMESAELFILDCGKLELTVQMIRMDWDIRMQV
jgi:hypothetical protein